MIKLLYLADREYITDWCNSITTDSYVSMDNGPVTSKIYDLIKDSHIDNGTYWASLIRTVGYNAVLIKEPDEYDRLSPMEMEVIAKTNQRFAESGEWDVVRFCHENLAEWQNPSGSTIQITIEDIIRAAKDEKDVDECIEEMSLAAQIPGKHPLLGGGSIGISKESKAKREAIEFLKWVYSPEISRLYTLFGGTSPCAAIYTDAEILSIYPWLSIAEEGFRRGRRRFENPEEAKMQRALEEILGTAIRSAVSGALNADEALNEAYKRFLNMR